MIYSMRESIEGLPLKYADNWETHVFNNHFLNMDFSLVTKLTIMKFAIHVAGTHWEGSFRILIWALVFVTSCVEK